MERQQIRFAVIISYAEQPGSLNFSMGYCMDDIVGHVGRILTGPEAGWFVKIQDDRGDTDGYLILVSRNKDFRPGSEGYDDWVADEHELMAYLRESGWTIEWEFE
jgi:hypothetical protein